MNHVSSSFREWDDSQAPALRLLRKLGYTYISPEEALGARNGSRSEPILERILEEQIRRINRIEYRGELYPFTAANVRRAIEALRDQTDQGVISTNESIYEMLMLGKSLEQEIEGDRKSFTLRYIDWEHPENNVLHVTKEFVVAGARRDIRFDLVLFVNGIPFVGIECKRRDAPKTIDAAINQINGYQERENGAPRFFHYAQYLLAVHPNEVRYGTVGTDLKHWAAWKEPIDLDPEVAPYLVGDLEDGSDRLPTEQDRSLYALCRPERLMELVRRYVVFDNGAKKVARYQQYFAVRHALERVATFDAEGRRRGGVIWHTQGSGKSLTMVMLAKGLVLDRSIANPRVILVTDRVDLDDQITGTFRAAGREVSQATTGANLFKLLSSPGSDVIATVIDKFDAAANRRDFEDTSREIFVLVDEGHRSQYGRMHARMRKILPNACYIGFTGTPLTKREKSTATKFGGIIDSYTIDQAVADGAVVPLLYEGRTEIATVDQKQLDKGFDRVAEDLNDYQKRDLKQKMAREDTLFKSDQIIDEIAYDIAKHYQQNFQGSGLKAQLAAPDKLTAIRYHRKFQEGGKINSAVVISAPDMREGDEDDYTDAKGEVRSFWRKTMEQFGDEKTYNTAIINRFLSADDDVELLIVVDKLLTGFDAPRNTVLYITKRLSEHSLLQAIARVNRVFPGKDYGYIIDYRGVLGELDTALATYRALADFDTEDVAAALTDVREQVRLLPQRYSELLEVFKGVTNRNDNEELQRFLADDSVRGRFYEKLSAYARTLGIALGTVRFISETPRETIDLYTSELRRFQALRRTVRVLYAEAIRYDEYEARIKKLMDTHISVEEIVPITTLVNIFNTEAFQAEVEKFATSTEAKAEMIAHRVKRDLTQRMDTDPILYARFSQLIQQVIDDYHAKRITDAEYLRKSMSIKDEVVSGRFSEVPAVLHARPEARAQFNLLAEVLKEGRQGMHIDQWNAVLAESGIAIEEIIQRNRFVDWHRNPDIEKRMRNEIEDHLLDLKKRLGIEIDWDQVDHILEGAIGIARSNRHDDA